MNLVIWSVWTLIVSSITVIIFKSMFSALIEPMYVADINPMMVVGVTVTWLIVGFVYGYGLVLINRFIKRGVL